MARFHPPLHEQRDQLSQRFAALMRGGDREHLEHVPGTRSGGDKPVSLIEPYDVVGVDLETQPLGLDESPGLELIAF
jgi:hypothetical protein